MAMITGGSVPDSSSGNPPAVKIGYYPPSDDFPPSAINTSFFTHIYYAFLVPSNVTFKLELTDETALLLSNFTTTLRHKTPPVKTLLSIGGGGGDEELSRIFASMVSNPSSRSNFIDSAIEVARKFGFDGLDLDWEYPESPKEMKALGHLLKQLRRKIKKEAQDTKSPPLLLTAAVYFSAEFFLDAVIRSYPIKYMEKYLDWANIMCFDYHGAWSNITGPNAPLFDPNSNVNSVYGLRSWINGGMSPKKLVMGLPLYGRTWVLKDPKDNGIGSIAIGPGPGGGQLSFKELEVLNNASSATVVYDADTVSVYSFNGSTWIAFDDANTITSKVGFAQALGLRGYFFWSVAQDSNWKISAQASKSWIL
ncbi:nod factor hydrolase protein 1-like [Argentina anserina]|uniref:nod factor hydrolase protein 1-like n=1 Tax=Argentina anserina TaxID=57926 RepID=UPI00217691B2|nr:nod factor hydrolase protein 1-like [Potentilla anserina]